MKGHADAETLAAFREELLSRRKAARVSAHLAACPRCAGLDAQLTEVTALLTRSAAPPMPDALTARIETAIAAEVLSISPGTVKSRCARGRARLLPRLAHLRGQGGPRAFGAAPVPAGPQEGPHPGNHPGIGRVSPAEGGGEPRL